MIMPTTVSAHHQQMASKHGDDENHQNHTLTHAEERENKDQRHSEQTS
jgi:hypothetical protein